MVFEKTDEKEQNMPEIGKKLLFLEKKAAQKNRMDGQCSKNDKKVVIYARVSTKDQEKEETVNTQIDLLTPIIQKEKNVLVDIIKDENISGDSEPEKRPGFSRLIEMATNGEIDEVWVASRDRIARNVDLMGFIRVTLDRQGVTVMALDDSKEKYLDKFKDVLSEMELDKYRQKRQEGINRAIRENRTLHRPPFGYISIDKKLVIDESKRGIIIALFRDFQEPMMSLKKLADKYEMGRSMIQRIRSNSIYTTGEVRWQGKVIYNVEPIISEDKMGENDEEPETGTQQTLF